MKQQVKATGVQQVLFLLDACRNDPTSAKADTINPLTEAYKRGFSFNARNREVEAFAAFYATSIGARAYEYAEKRQGYFSWAIVEGLSGKAANSNSEVTLGSLVNYVQERVAKQVQIDLGAKVQKPFAIIEGYQANELILSIGNAERKPISSPLPAETDLNSPRKGGEYLFWQETEKRNTIAAYESYLSAYPKGDFAGVAKIRLGNLNWANFEPIARRLLKYSQVIYFREGLSRAHIDGVGPRMIDKTGKEAFQARYFDINNFSEGLALAGKLSEGNEKKYGYIDKSGKEVIPFEYDILSDSFSEGLAAVRLNGKVGFIDRTGKVIIPFKYTGLLADFSEGLAAVRVDGQWGCGYIDKNGEVAIPFKYDDNFPFSEGLAAVKSAGKWGFIDKTGKEVVPIKYDFVYGFSEGLAAVVLNGKIAFIDKSGKEVIPFKHPKDGLHSLKFHEGLASIKMNNKVGFIDRAGEIVIPLKYDYAYDFKDGLSMVEINDKWGFIDKAGKEVIRVKYNGHPWCWEFIDGFIGVTLNGKRGFVDIYGNEYFDFK